jgi:hypothetical protein
LNKLYSKNVFLVLGAAVLAGTYLFSIWLTFTDAERRGLSLEVPAASADHMTIDLDVVDVDESRLEMTARLSFRLMGKLAQDEATPARDLKLVLNTISGPQEFLFAKGQRINPIEAVFPLDGDVNLYPIDHYSGVLWLFAAMPQKRNPAPTTPGTSTNVVSDELAASPDLPVSTEALEKDVHVDTSTTLHASIVGLTFRGSRSIESAQTLKGLTGVEVKVQRSNRVLFIAIATMLMMTGLSGGLVVIVLDVLSGRRSLEAFQITIATTLIFGFPALRNIQPGVPPPGTFGDSIVFTWAEMTAAASAVALIAHWLVQGADRKEPPIT